MKYIGYIPPFKSSHCFGIPIFFDGSDYFYQKVSEDLSRIVAFDKIGHKPHLLSSLGLNYNPTSVDSPIYVYAREEGVTYVGDRTVMLPLFQRIILIYGIPQEVKRRLMDLLLKWQKINSQEFTMQNHEGLQTIKPKERKPSEDPINTLEAIRSEKLDTDKRAFSILDREFQPLIIEYIRRIGVPMNPHVELKVLLLLREERMLFNPEKDLIGWLFHCSRSIIRHWWSSVFARHRDHLPLRLDKKTYQSLEAEFPEILNIQILDWETEDLAKRMLSRLLLILPPKRRLVHEKAYLGFKQDEIAILPRLLLILSKKERFIVEKALEGLGRDEIEMLMRVSPKSFHRILIRGRNKAQKLLATIKKEQ